MQMLMCRSAGNRKDGKPRRVPIIRIRERRYGPILEERVLSVKTDVLITGANASGKSKFLCKFNTNATAIWKDAKKIYIRAVEPMSAWVEHEEVKTAAENCGKEWRKHSAHEKVEALKKWVTENKVVVLLDDAHKLAGRKLDVAIQICREAHRVITGTFSEQATPISLRLLLDKRQPQRIALDSKAAYDQTSLVLWFVILAAFMAGWWQLAAVVGGMKVLAGGRRAAKQV